jgi:hypothetical protein
LTRFGVIEINKNEGYSEAVNGYQISPHLQELMTYAGQIDCYLNAEETLKKFLGVEVNAMQIHRVTNTYGSSVGQLEIEFTEKEKVTPEEHLYAQVDGSMILTRSDGYSEVKVGRVFRENDYIRGEKPGQGWIKKSDYEAIIGGKDFFIEAFEEHLEGRGLLNNQIIA